MRNKKSIFYINTALVLVIALFVVNAVSPQGHALIKQALAAVGNITGEGEVNYIARFVLGAPLAPTNEIGNSIIYDDGTNVGIGTVSPGRQLDIAGGVIRLQAGAVRNWDIFAQNNPDYFGIYDTGAGAYR